MIKIERNKSITYFLPIFDKFVSIKYFNLLENTYFWYDDISTESFCLLYKFDGRIRGEYKHREGFVVYEQELRNSKYYLGECDYNEYVLYMFELPKELQYIKYTLIEGKYSKLKEIYKKYILDFILQRYGSFDASVIKQILYKDAKYRNNLSEQLKIAIPENAELSSIINIENEMFSNHVINKKEIENESKNDESREWNPWSTSNANKG